MNYPSPDVPFTRIVEYKHVPNQPTAVKEGRVRCAASCCRSTLFHLSLPRVRCADGHKLKPLAAADRSARSAVELQEICE